jgi:Lon protease-like protein
MPRAPFHLSLQELPDLLPVFPLTGALLLPGERLPLNVFEPRYLNMVEDALGARRLIGMVQPLEPESGIVSPTARLYPVGCAGRIVNFSETGDGRFLITLAGVARFDIAAEAEGRNGYRRMQVAFARFAGDLSGAAAGEVDRARLLEALRAYLKIKKIGADWKAIEGSEDGALVNALAMTCPFDPGEKQALLEAPGVAERGRTLIAMLEMAVLGAGAPVQPARH